MALNININVYSVLRFDASPLFKRLPFKRARYTLRLKVARVAHHCHIFYCVYISFSFLKINKIHIRIKLESSATRATFFSAYV